MATFTYRGLVPDGQRVAGEVEAENQSEAARQLGTGDLLITEIRKKPRTLAQRLGRERRPLKGCDLILFARSLASLYRAGVSLSRALEAIASQSEDPYHKKVMDSVRSHIMRGKTMADAMAMQKPAFPEILIRAVEVGETAGALDKTLISIAALLETDEVAKAQFKAALRYPMFVLAAVGGALVVLLTLVVPKFAETYAEMGADLPRPTALLIQASETVVAYWYLILGIIGGAVFLGRRWVRTDVGRRQWDAVILRIPVIGSIAVKGLTSRACEILRVLVEAGLPILVALEMTAKAVNNSLVGKDMTEIRNAVAEGSDLASKFRSSRVFPSMVAELVAVGEQCGTLGEVLGEAANYYRREADQELKRMNSLIEPVLTVSLGVLVLFFALAIFLPIWDQVSLYRGG